MEMVNWCLVMWSLYPEWFGVAGVVNHIAYISVVPSRQEQLKRWREGRREGGGKERGREGEGGVRRGREEGRGGEREGIIQV